MFTVYITGLDTALEKYSGHTFGTLKEARERAAEIRRAGDPNVGRIWIAKEVDLGQGCKSGQRIEWA